MSVDVKEIADGLTKAQRASMRTVPDGWFNVPSFGAWGELLAVTGLFQKYHHHFARRFSAAATSSGLAVRNYLLATEPTA